MSLETTLQKGFKLIDNGDYKSCIRHVNRALELFKNNSDLISLRGEAHFKIKDYLPALKDFNKAADLEPNNPFRFSSRAFLKDAMGDTAGAVEDYKMALHLDPEDATILNNLGVLEEKLGYKKAAKRKYQLADDLFQLDQSNQVEEEAGVSEKAFDNSKKKSYLSMISSIFIDKKQRKEFFQFVRNGFKLK